MTLLETSNLNGALRHSCDNGANPWSQERVKLLTELWVDGRSAGYISTKLGYPFTRSAILGKVHRLGLASRTDIKPHVKYGNPWANRRPDGYRRKALPKVPIIRIEAKIIHPVERSDVACSFAQLGRDMCRYPYGEVGAPDFAFCGRHADGTYCPGHTRLCYSRPTQ